VPIYKIAYSYIEKIRGLIPLENNLKQLGGNWTHKTQNVPQLMRGKKLVFKKRRNNYSVPLGLYFIFYFFSLIGLKLLIHLNLLLLE
jgi:hypothetical protein